MNFVFLNKDEVEKLRTSECHRIKVPNKVDCKKALVEVLKMMLNYGLYKCKHPGRVRTNKKGVSLRS